MSKYNRVVHKDGKHLEVDVYDVLEAFNVTCPALQHLIKKALCVGIRGHKDESQDLQDILDSANRAIDLAADRADGEILDFIAEEESRINIVAGEVSADQIIGRTVRISSLTKEKQQEIKEAIEKVGITGSLNPVFLTEEQAKPESADTAKARSAKQKKLDLISKLEKIIGAEK